MKILPPVEPQDTMLAAMAYPFWFILSPYIIYSEKKEEPFVKFHAMQALALGAVISIIALVILLFGILIFQGAPSVKDINASVSNSETYNYTESTARTGSYMMQGCASLTIFLVLGGVGIALFAITMFCAGKAWKGEFFQLPFAGTYIIDKYFADFPRD